MPTFKFYLNGKVYKQFSGADERQLRAVTAEIARKAAQANIEVTPEALAQYYAEFDPSKVGKVEEILAKYKHADLVKNLKAKYGKAPATQKRKKYDPKLEKAKKEEALKGASLRKASVEELEQELQRRNGDKDEDELEEMMVGPKAYKAKPNKLVVIGAGPAGLAAAVYAARAGLKPVVVAPPMGGQLMGKGVDVENFPGVEGSTGPSIVKQMRRQAFAFETRFEFDMATSIDLSKRPFAVSHAHGMACARHARWLARPLPARASETLCRSSRNSSSSSSSRSAHLSALSARLQMLFRSRPTARRSQRTRW